VDTAAERSLRLWGVTVPLTRALFYAPVFFLYLNSHLSIERVLQLEAIYYLAVVVLEVPSGYLSDRVGRAPTLRISAAAAVVAYLLFLFGDSFLVFALAQIVFATFFAFLSGTEAAYHVDLLESLGRADEFAERQGRLLRRAFYVKAASALVGGFAGSFDLRAPYALSAIGALALFALLLFLREPPHHGPETPPFRQQLRSTTGRLAQPALAWICAYVVVQTTLEHVPFEFAQPWLARLFGESGEAVRNTPIATGVLLAGVAWLGAVASGRAASLRRRFGTAPTLLGLTALQTLVIAAMAAFVHPIVGFLIVLRSVQPAVGNVLVAAAVAPRLPRHERATFLSLLSLAGRVGYASTLFGLSMLASGDADALPRMLGVAALLGGVAWLGLFLFRPRRPLEEV
jgi:predicted MFS family arabinose efflux permease